MAAADVMGRAWRVVLVFAMTALAVLGSQVGASACSCVPGGTFAEAVESTPVVFQATPTRIQDRTERADGGETGPIGKTVTLRVASVFKGDLAQTVTVETGNGGGDCGYPFEVGRAELVFAYGDETALGVGSCGRTTALSQVAAEDRAFLGAGAPPAGETAGPDAGGEEGPTVVDGLDVSKEFNVRDAAIVGGLAGVATSLGVVALLRRRRS